MKPLAELTEADLQELIGLQEGQAIEFKRSDALIFSGPERDKRVSELVKDVTAMANAAGGRIYYGVVENRETGRAESLDNGLSNEEINPDQIGNLLTGHVEPFIRNVEVRVIPLNGGRNAVVVDVPQGAALAPHQSRRDKKYYRRHDRSILPMFDHEIRDVMRRSVVPDILADITVIKLNDDNHQMRLELKNLSDEPVLYFTVDLLTDRELAMAVPGGFTQSRATLKTPNGVVNVHAHSRSFITPHIVPLFKPRTFIIAEWTATLLDNYLYWGAVTVSAPGFHGHWLVQMVQIDGRVQVKMEREV